MSVRRAPWFARFLAMLAATVCVWAPSPAAANIDGVAPTTYRTFRVYGDSLSIGNTLMRNLPAQPLVNSILLGSSTARVSGVPSGATVEGAFLFWSGSTDPDAGIDRSVQLTAANGRTSSVSADTCLTATARLGGGTVPYYYCRADVTSFVSANPVGSSYNGVYGVGGVQALPGTLNSTGQCINPLCQAFYAGWSMVVVWSSEDVTTLRDVSIFDGFRLYDETPTSAAVATYTIGGFDVAEPPEASFRFFGMEGDALLGVPPQDSDPVLRCTTCFDYVAFNGTKLSDSVNPANNVFNSTLPEGSAIGVDIDSFDVSALVRTGDSTVRIEVGSGDGDPRTGHANDAGGGELFLMGYNVLTINRLAPNFRNRNTFITADPSEVAPGEVVFYTVQVTNDGSLDASGVRVTVPLPPNMEYVPGSTRLDGVLVADVGGASPIFGGMSLGTIPRTGDNDRRITFRLRVLPDTPNGTVIPAAATIRATELAEPEVTDPALVRVVAPSLLTPQKTWLDLNGGSVEPGDFVTYTIRLRKDPERAAAALTFVDDVSPYARLQSVSAGSFTDRSELTGGANGTGQVRIEDISMPLGASAVTVSYTVRIASVAELVAAGVDPGSIDGLLVRNQGQLQAAFLASPLLTDDPGTPASPDPTDLRLSSSVNFRNASTFKRAQDLNGGALEPGDTIRFTISLRNAGNQSAVIDLTDPLPAGTTNPRLVAPVPGVELALPPAGRFRAGEVRALGLTVGPRTTITIRVDADVSATAANGTRIANVAALRVPDFPDQNQDLAAEVLVVSAGPDFSDATKVATGAAGGFEAGDTVEYTIALSNTGNRPGLNVRVTDIVDANLTAITPRDGGVYDAARRRIVWTLGDIPVGERREVRFSARINVSVANGTRIPNQANVLVDDVEAPYPTDDPATVAVDDPTVIVVAALPALVAEKTVVDVNGGAFEPGDAVRWDIAIRNDGRAPATNVVVTDTLPTASITDVTLTAGGFLRGTTAEWSSATTPSLASIAPGATVRVSINARLAVGLANGATVSNQARLSASGGVTLLSDDPTTPAPSDPTVLVVSARPNLSTSEKTVVDVNGGAPQPGDALVWTIRVVNSGSGPARDLVVSDPVHSALIDVTPSAGGVFDPRTRTITWTPSTSIPAGGELSLSFRATIAVGTANGTRITNQASLSAADLGAPVLTDDPATPALDDPTAIVVESRPDFATSTKEVFAASGATEFRPGDEVVYRITVRNTGTENASDVQVVDPIDPSLVDVSAGEGGTVSGGTARWSVGALAAGASTTLSLRGTIAFPLADGTVVSNQARITATGVAGDVTDDPRTPANDDPTVFTVSSRPDLTTSIKTYTDVNGGSVRPGDRIDYVILVVNTGTEDAVGVEVSDVIDANLVDIVPGDGVYDPRTRTLRFGPATTPGLSRVAVGDRGAVQLRFSATVAAGLANGTVISNQAVISAGSERTVTDDPSTAPDDDPTSFQVISAFDFSQATKTVSAPASGVYRPGDEVTWTIRFANTGDAAARDVVVTDAVDASTTFVAASSGGTFDGRSVRWDARSVPALAQVDPGREVELSFRARINTPLANGTRIANQASITAPGSASAFVTDDPSTAAVDDPTAFVVTSSANLSRSTKAVTDLDGDGIFEPGDQVEYVIEVVNEGDSPALSVRIDDPVPAELTDVRPLEGGRVEGASLVWDAASTPRLASVAPGGPAAVRVRFVGTIRPGTADGVVVSNQAQVSAEGLAPVPTDDPATSIGDDDPTRFTVVASPRLEGFTKAAEDLDGAPLLAGDRVRYTIAVTNVGTQTATNVRVDDPMPEALTDVVALDGGTVSGGTGSGGSVSWVIPTLEPGETRTLRIEARVVDGTPDGTVIGNQAFASADGLPAVPSDDPSTPDVLDDVTILVVNALPDLSQSTKAVVDVDGGLVERDDLLIYTIEVVNSGAGVARDLVVTDPLDASLTGVTVGQGGTLGGGAIRWSAATTPALAEIGPGESVTVSFEARVASTTANGTTILNQATLVAGSAPPVVTDDPSTEAVDDPTAVLVAFPELDTTTLEVFDLDGGSVEPGDVLAYRIRIAAGAGIPLTGVAAQVPVDALLVDVVPLSGGVFDEASGLLRWDPSTTPALARIETFASTLLEFEARVADDAPLGALIAAQGTVLSAEVPAGVLTDDPRTPEADDPTVVQVSGESAADLSGMTKVVEDLDGGYVEPGDVLRYTIVVPNDGIGATSGLTVTDATPGLTSFVDGSLVVDGVAVPGGNALAGGLAVGELAPGGSIEIVFDVRVNADAPVGARIDNVAFASEAGGAVVRSDDPTTPEPDDPTSVVVGGVPDLSRTLKEALPLDENGDRIPQVGETLRYRITIPNRGPEPATGVVFDDPVPANARYVAGTLSLNGVALSDAADGDPGAVSGNPGSQVVTVAVGTLVPGAQAVIEFDVIPVEGDRVSNQGFVSHDGGVEPTDDDSDPTNGDSPTVTLLGGGSLVRVGKVAIDADGGDVEAGDVINYVLTIEAFGDVFDPLVLLDTPDPGVSLSQLIAVPIGVEVEFGADGATLTLAPLEAGDVRTVIVQGVLSGELVDGEVVCNAVASDDPRVTAPEPACVAIGGRAGVARLEGAVFRELGAANGELDADTDETLAEFLVRLVRPGFEDFAFAEQVTSGDGAFTLDAVSPGTYRMQVFANRGPDFGGALFFERDIELPSGSVARQDALIDPTGVVYDAESRRPISGVRVWLYERGANKDVLDRTRVVDPSLLPRPSQQGQTVPATGLYRFDLPAGTAYDVFVDTASTPWVFPSSAIPPTLEEVAAGAAERVEVVDAALPEQVDAGAERYGLTLSAGAEGGVFKNHVPLDAAGSDIVLTKRADRVAASVGDIITYTISVRNESGADLSYDEARGTGGVFVADAIPGSFRYVDGSGVGLIRDNTTGEVRTFPVLARGELLLEFGAVRGADWTALDLPAGSELEIRYFLVVGSDTEPGRRYRNRAEVRSADNDALLSNVDHVDVRVEYDPVFDQGVLIGRAFCDLDGDGRHDRGERGLPGARIYLDVGYYTETDEEGQYHFGAIDPGLHLVKIDVNTLPVGSTVISDEARAFDVTRGLPSLIDFGIDCAEHLVTDIDVVPGDGALAEAQRLRRQRYVDVRADVNAGTLAIDDVAIPLPSARMAVAAGGAPVLPPRAAAEPASPASPAPAPPEPNADSDAAADAAPPAPPAAATVERAAVDLRVADGALVEPLGVAMELPPGTTRWVFEVAEASSGVVVYQRSGSSADARTLTWDGRDGAGALALGGERVYEARLRVLVGESQYAAATPVLLRVADTRERYLVEERGHGHLFDGAAPNADLVALLEGVRQQLVETRPHRIVVEAHLDDRDGEVDEDGITRQQADAVARYLVLEFGIDEARIDARGLGVRRPIYPNIGDRTRNTNRRVEVRVVDPNPDIRVPALPTMEPIVPGVRLGERFEPADAEGVVEVDARKPEDGVIVATLIDRDGAAHASMIAVREDVALERGRTVLPELDVVVELDAGVVRVGGASSPIDGLGMRVGVEESVATLSGRMLEPTMRFPFSGVPEGVQAWTFEVFERGGGSVYEESGQGAPPGGKRWQGRTSDGTPLTAGSYEARLTARFVGGGLATTAPIPFEVVDAGAAAAPPAAPEAAADVPVVRVNGRRVEPGPDGALRTRVRAATGATILVDVMRGGARVVVPVSVPAGNDAMFEAPIPLRPFSILVDAGAAPVAPPAPAGAPSADPAVPSPIEAPPVETAPAPSGPFAPVLPPSSAGQGPADGDTPAAPATRAPEPPPSPGSAPLAPTPPAAAPPATAPPAAAPPAAAPPAAAPLPGPGDAAPAPADGEGGDGSDDGEEDGEGEAPDAPFNPFAPVGDARWLLMRPASAPGYRMQQSDPFSPFAPAGTGSGAPADSATDTPPGGEAPAGDAPGVAPSGSPAGRSGSAIGTSGSAQADPAAPAVAEPGTAPAGAGSAAPRFSDIASFYAEELDAALSTDDDDLARALAASEAAVISVQLPPQGVTLPTNRLSIYGSTVPTNRVFVAGREVRVASDGRFDTVVELPGGASVLEIETLDRDGNRGRLEWPVDVATSSLFLMALGDTAVGSRHADIAGAHGHNSTTTDSGVLLYGQARLYLKGWISGQQILDGFWDDVDVTAHVDTGRRREYESFVNETIQPDRQYPVYGDSSEQISDVNSRGKVYVLVQADESSATWGNFNTEIRGIELLSYQRNLYGAQVEFDEVIADEFRTEVQVHVADEDEDVVQTYDYLRGTGGSIYYLRNRQVVEGSERVTMVVRDSISGTELARIPMSRNTDYTMRYREGRIIMKRPVSSVADDGLLLGQYVTSRSLLDGHPVYLEVAYDYEGSRNESDLSYGVHARETFYDLVSVGGGIVEESRVSGPGYRLWGVEAGVGPTERTRVEFEYAGSESEDLGYGYSDDGGLTFDRFRLASGETAEGNALLVRARAELADVLDTERDEIWSVGGYFQEADRGFFSNGRILDQGEEKLGFSSRLHMNEVNQLSFRLDRITSTVEDLTTEELEDLAEIRRQIVLTQYDYEFSPAHLTLSHEHTFADDMRLEDGYTTDIVGAKIGVQILRWLRLGVGQEVIVAGDDPNVIRGSGGDSDTRAEDRFITSVEAGVRVVDDIEIVATERFRYSGEHSALLGLNAAVSEDSDVYVQQRLDSQRDNRGAATTTVVGGEQRFGEDGTGRSYGEYHVDSGVSGERSRAVLGFGKRWNVVDGLSLDVGYERSQTLAAEGVQSESTRNTGSFGWEYLHLDELKLSGLFEARFDNGSLHTPSAAPCLGGDIIGNPAYCRDRLTSVGDRRQLVSLTTLELKPTSDITFFGRFDIVVTENTTLDVLESRDVEGTVGVALRPVDFNWINLLTRYTYLGELAPYQLELGTRRDERSHVFSLSPIFNLPYRLQLVEKVAVRNIELDVEGMPTVDNTLLMLINRLNYRVFRQWDVGAEYRFLRQTLTQDWRHGLLLDVNYILADHVRIGVGYNFTRFAEDELGDFDRDNSGFFFRVAAQY